MTSHDVILGLLMDRKLSGYEIKTMFQRWLSYFFDASYGTIYPTLAKMEKEGLLIKESVRQDKKPDKNVYAITPLGKERFMAYLASGLQDNVVRSDLMTRLFFGKHAEPALVIRWLEESRDGLALKLRQLEADYAMVRGTTKTEAQLICIELGLDNVRGTLRNIEASIARLQASSRESGANKEENQ